MNLHMTIQHPEVWKIKKFDNIFLQLCNAVYKENTIEEWKKVASFRSSRKPTTKLLRTTKA